MVAPNYAETRSLLAKKIGLGQHRKRVNGLPTTSDPLGFPVWPLRIRRRHFINPRRNAIAIRGRSAVSPEASHVAFRAQLVIVEQQQLYDHWVVIVARADHARSQRCQADRLSAAVAVHQLAGAKRAAAVSACAWPALGCGRCSTARSPDCISMTAIGATSATTGGPSTITSARPAFLLRAWCADRA